MQKEATSNRPSKRTQQQGDRRMVQSSGECEGRAASERAQTNAQGGELRETEEHSVLNRDHASQPPSRAAVETARIESTKGSYEDNPLLSITQPTSAPNNTPVQSPAASPAGGRQAALGRAGELRDNGSLVEPSSEHARDRGERALPPPRALLGGGAREVADDGGCVPPRRGSGGHVGVLYRRGSRTEEENSPLSIINRRQIFSTSDSRSSASGPPAAGASGGDESGDEEIGVAPQSFYFDKDRHVTDPHVKHDQADEKINISSWLRSRHGAEVYSLSDSAGNGKSSENSRQATKDSEQFSIQDGLISPQAPRSALSMGSSCGRVMSRDSVPEEAAAKAEEEDEHYVPPPPPKFINSKLDGVRSRLLLNPRVAPPKIDADMGTATAAAVLSNMRSSPFHFSERSQQYSSRPSSSSFSKSYPRPIIRIHHREHTAGENDESAVLDGDEEDDDAGERDQEDLNGVVKTTGERLRKNSLQAEREVTWNKNGKRINRRLTAASAGNRRPKKPRSSAAKGRSSSSHTDDDGSRVSDDGDESYTNEYHDEDEEDEEDSAARSESKSSRQKAGVGSRSRTGCWICRLRKKKCTEERPSCFNCQRLNLQCHYDAIKPDFVSDPKKKMLKLLEIKTKTKEAKRNAMRKKPSKANS